MKMKLFALMLAISCLFSLTACGSAAASSAETASVPASEPQTFGSVTMETVPVQEAETTDLPAAPAEVSAAEPADVSMESTASVPDFTEQAVTAAIICDAIDMLPYTPEDSMYLWRSVGYLIGQVGTNAEIVTMDGDFGKIDAESAAIFAYAMDADFSGEMPSVTEEDPLISRAKDGGYLINMLSQGNLELHMTQNRIGSGGDVCTEEAELFRDGESLGVYTVTLTPYTGGSPGNQYFTYSIQDISPN